MFKGVLLSGPKVESPIRRIVALDTKLPYVKGGKIMSYMKAGKMMARESEGWAYVIQAQDNTVDFTQRLPLCFHSHYRYALRTSVSVMATSLSL